MRTVVVDAILFDLDGTLIDSTPGVLKAWDQFARDYSFDAAEIAKASHGRRLQDTLREACRIDDDDKLRAEVTRFEEAVIEGGPTLLPGVRALFTNLNSQTDSVWTIVTSATDVYASRALERCGIAPGRFGCITSNDVSRGKPHPDPYLAGARKCGLEPTKCLVVEDAPSGLKSGKAAGCTTLAVCTSHSRRAILESDISPDYIIQDLSRISVRWVNKKAEVTIDETPE